MEGVLAISDIDGGEVGPRSASEQVPVPRVLLAQVKGLVVLLRGGEALLVEVELDDGLLAAEVEERFILLDDDARVRKRLLLEVLVVEREERVGLGGFAIVLQSAAAHPGLRGGGVA